MKGVVLVGPATPGLWDSETGTQPPSHGAASVLWVCWCVSTGPSCSPRSAKCKRDSNGVKKHKGGW